MTYIYLYLILFNFIIFKNFTFISKKINFFDKPDFNRKLHHEQIANIGGIIIFTNISIFIIYCTVKELNNYSFLTDIYPYLSIFFIIGLIDDKINLNANLKLFLFFILIILLILGNDDYLIKSLQFTFFVEEINFKFLSYIFTVICFLSFINSVNMFDGINLQSSFYISFLSFIFISKNYLSEFFIIILISLFFFSLLNYKNKCFLGNNGTYFLSFLISCIFISSYNSHNLLHPEEIFLIMLLPGLELIRLTISRILKRKHPFSADKNHIHHLLLTKYKFNKTILISCLMVSSPYLTSIFFQNYLVFVSILYIVLYFFITGYLLKK